ncbi:MAG: hypothetical protein M3Q03_20795 [Chloroflexota bacterium]|nr:hypothetical protein [Chloroflexota bacterium]
MTDVAVCGWVKPRPKEVARMVRVNADPVLPLQPRDQGWHHPSPVAHVEEHLWGGGGLALPSAGRSTSGFVALAGNASTARRTD